MFFITSKCLLYAELKETKQELTGEMKKLQTENVQLKRELDTQRQRGDQQAQGKCKCSCCCWRKNS